MCDYRKGKEDRLHILAECEFYGDIRNLDGWVVQENVTGMIDVSQVLAGKDKYERLSVYGEEVFRRWRLRPPFNAQLRTGTD